MKIINRLLLMLCINFISFAIVAAEITPHKYTDEEWQNGGPKYDIPSSSRFTAKRMGIGSPDIVYYFSKPSRDKFPIAILVGGSTTEDKIRSIINFHRYFIREFLDLGIGVITIEQQGVDGNQINKTEFIEHYTRSNRLSDHHTVIEHLKKHPPKGWNGKMIFLGVSEGGPIVTTLTTDYSQDAHATINWSGAGDISWREQLWAFMQADIEKLPWHIKLRRSLPSWMIYSIRVGITREAYDKIMDEAIKNPTIDLKFAGMTYKYHHDILLNYKKPDYENIKTPYLVVAGAEDSIIESADLFVQKAQEAGVLVTYMRIPNMDHFVRKRQDVIDDSFAWLKKQLEN